MARQNLA